MKNDAASFQFRFPLHVAEDEKENTIDDPVTDMIREQIQNLLEIVNFTYQGTPVHLDGFCYQSNPAHIYQLYHASCKAITERD